MKPGEIRFVTAPAEATSDRLDKLKHRLKPNAKLYNFLIETISPVGPQPLPRLLARTREAPSARLDLV